MESRNAARSKAVASPPWISITRMTWVTKMHRVTRVIWVTRMTLVTSIAWVTRVTKVIRKNLSDSRNKGDLGN